MSPGKVTISCAVCPDLKRKLERRARLERRSMSAIMREAIRAYLERPPLGQILIERGLITPEQLEEALREQRKRQAGNK